MSPVAHSLVGLTLGNLAGRNSPKRAWFLVAGVALANLPDWPLPGWGHDAYHVSHSLAVNLALIGLAVLVARCWLDARSLAFLALAWLSHLLLDSLYNHGKGVQIGWPLTDFRLTLPIPWLQTLEIQQPLSWRNLSVALLELLTFAPLALLGWWMAKERQASR
ncbi:hypothetical protein MalM25_00700 [Planctomycetes bacterium MalM25]|nr:hypothetical protein MalM25_00700 [Planctomycetes bacterium MalM25]